MPDNFLDEIKPSTSVEGRSSSSGFPAEKSSGISAKLIKSSPTAARGYGGLITLPCRISRASYAVRLIKAEVEAAV